MLVEFGPGERVGSTRLATIENGMSDLLGRKVDMDTAGCPRVHLRDEVVREAKAIHGQA